MEKKGIITIQFNWIYVIIIGGLIIALFVGIINKQRSVSEVAASGEMQRKLETLLVGAASSLGTSNLVDIGRTEINVDCFGYSVGPVKPFDPGISFSPSRIKVRGKQFITWTHPFNAPYLVTNFLYVTSKQVRYIIIGDPNDNTFKKINSTLPEQLNIEFVDSMQATIRYKNEDKTRFVFIGELQSLDAFDEADVSVLEIRDKLYFHKKPPTSLSLTLEGTYPNIGADAVLYGAIFSEDFETFKCNIEDVDKRFELVNQIYIDRTTKLRDSTDPLIRHCSSLYTDAITWFENLEVNPMAAMQLGNINGNLQIQSCPLLY